MLDPLPSTNARVFGGVRTAILAATEGPSGLPQALVHRFPNNLPSTTFAKATPAVVVDSPTGNCCLADQKTFS